MKKETVKSYLSVIGSMLIFGTIGIFRKNLAASSSLLACVRGFLGSAVIFLVSLLKRRKPEKLNVKNTVLLIISGILIGLNWIFLFEGYNYTTVAVSTLCYYMSPTVVILLSPIFFKEKLSIKKAICVAVSVVGMVLVSGVTNTDAFLGKNIIGVGFSLCAAVFYASVVIINKNISYGDAYIKTVIQLFSAGVVLLPYVLLTEKTELGGFGYKEIILTVILGVVHTGVAYLLYFAGMGNIKAQSVAILSYIDPISALVLSAVILNESMTVYAVFGAVMIIGAAIVSEIDFGLKNKTQKV